MTISAMVSLISGLALLAADLVQATDVNTIFAEELRDTPDTVYSVLRPCPARCSGAPDSWYIYSSVDRLAVCHQSLLLDFSIYTPLNDPGTQVKI